jgi:ATP-dependent RNA helicase HelY
MASLILRTADNLRQIASLKDTHPEVAACAYRAREAILREPVLFL